MRRNLALVVALLVGATLAVVPATASAGAETEVSTDRTGWGSSHVGTSLLDPEKKVAVRSYGGGPVRQSASGQTILIEFQGSRGDKVALTRSNRGADVSMLPAKLVGPLHATVPRAGRPWWTLRRDGWHTLRFDSYVGQEPTAVQLTKLRFTDVERDGEARTLPVRRGFVWAAGFEVPEKGLLSGVVLGDGTQLITRPDKKNAVYLGRAGFVLGDGLPVATGNPSRFPRSRAQGAGSVVRVLTAGGVASAVTPERVTGALDGPAVPADTKRAQAVEVVVDGADGQWISTVSPMLESWGHTTLLIGPDGDLVDRASYRGVWQLRGTGRSRLLLFPHQGTLPTPMTLSSVVVGPTLVADAPATRVVADATRGTILPVEGTAFYKKIVATNATLTGDWWGYLVLAHVPYYVPGCLGCGERDLAFVNAESPTSMPGNGSWLYLPPTNGTGSIDLQALYSGD